MGWLKNMLPKAPKRYEDIAAPGTKRLGRLQKLRLILFFAKHPDEAERYNNDFEARMVKKFGENLYAGCTADPRKKLKELREDIRGLRKDIRTAEQEQRELLSRIDDRERTLNARVLNKEAVF
jgi:vacuolar-type H+-ATPase subunit I/STV1